MKYPALFYTLIAFLILFLSPQTFPQTHISSGIVSGKWLKQNSPYYIDGEIKIPRSKKLVIEPGVKVIFTGHYKIIVNGILESKGTKQDSIYFFPSDTAVRWHGIRFIEAEDFSSLEYCVLKNGKTDLRPPEVGYIEGEIKVPSGKKLVIEPGVKIIFTGHHKLIVNGILEARGTKQNSIYFFPAGSHGLTSPENTVIQSGVPRRSGRRCPPRHSWRAVRRNQ